MTMSSTKKKQTISDKINQVLKPKELAEDVEDNEARFEEFSEHQGVDNTLSDIRKRNAKHLSELDSKYKGKVVNRKDLDLDDASDDSSDDEASEDEANYATDSDEDDNSDSGEEVEENDSENSSAEESGSDLEDDDCDISQFVKPSTSSATVTSQESNELIKKVSLNEEIKKGVCVQSQLKMWEKLLEVRIKSQKMLITANSFPDHNAHLELSSLENSEFAEKVEKTCDGIHGLLDNLLELQSTLCNRFPESKDVLSSTKRKRDRNGSGGFLKKSKLAETSDRIEENYNLYSNYRNEVLTKWHERTKSAKDLKNPAANPNILTKIENSLLGKKEMIRKSQIYRGDYEIYGVDKPQVTNENGDPTPGEIELPEIFDDSEFYHQLLRELIEYKSNNDENQSEITQKFIELQKVRSKMKKKVDTRASKGRKIRYIVHNKLVNFMPPRDTSEYTDEAKTELYNSLFGMANQGEKL